MSSKHTCPAKVYGGSYLGHRCSRNAAYEHEGVFFCKTHHPPTVKAKDEKRHEEWRRKWDEEKAARKVAEDARKEMERKASCFDEMLEALRLADRFCGSLTSDVCGDEIHIPIRAAISKATGEQS